MNGYTTIEINGKVIGLKFGYPAIKEFTLSAVEKASVYFDGDTLSGLGIAKLLHCAYKNNCLIREEEPVLTLADFSEWVDETEEVKERVEVLKEVMKAYADSRYTKKLIDAAQDAKKKTSSKSSKK